MKKHHLIISGTGRAGTTFLIQLFTALGLDTGFTDLTSHVLENCNAGMEIDLRLPEAPYIIKNPWLCDYLDEAIERGNLVIDHAIIPIRDLYAAAESRRDVTARAKGALRPEETPGGLWHTANPEEQETVLANQFYKIMYTLARRDIPLTLLYFPRLIHEPDYLYRKLKLIFGELNEERFFDAFARVARPELVHDFRK